MESVNNSIENKFDDNEVDGGNTSVNNSGNKTKEKKGKKKDIDTSPEQVNGSPDSTTEIKKAFEALTVSQAQRSAKNVEEALRKPFHFWKTQPVPHITESVPTECNGPIEPNKSIESIRQESYSLPDGFKWDTLTLDDPLVLKELYTLLNENYVEDEDSMFRFDYPPSFLKWALQPPGWLKEWHVGVRVVKSGRLVGFISGIPAKVSIYKKVQKVVEINFLCVHKKLRMKRVAPVLIREITRRVNLTGIFQAVYTAGIYLPKPVGTCRYYHRSLNPKKLLDVKFSHLTRNMTMQRTLKLYKLPETTKIEGFRKLVIEDVPQAHDLLQYHLEKFDLCPVFSLEEFVHWFLPQQGIVDSFVVKNQRGQITDMVSYYTLPSSVMHHPVHRSIKAAYSFYNVSKKNTLLDLMQDALITARNDDFDVFNALDLMENKVFLENLKFGAGDGNLHYYFYNWKCATINSDKIGLVLQ